jgi:hypothetical protein
MDCATAAAEQEGPTYHRTGMFSGDQLYDAMGYHAAPSWTCLSWEQQHLLVRTDDEFVPRPRLSCWTGLMLLKISGDMTGAWRA